jgi:hypothetical protein
MSLLPRVSAAALVLSGLIVASPALAEILQYVDSQGRLHFTQDISQVPPEYRNQVERRELKKDINVTGSETAQGSPERMRAMAKRRSELNRAAARRSRQNSMPGAVAPRSDPLKGAPEPRKYDKECDYVGVAQKPRCRKWLTPEWSRWNAANGGDNGKPDTRRRVGED